jgi:hypothetical protein
MERASRVLTIDDMRTASETAVRERAGLGGAEVHEVTLVSDAVLVRQGLWRISVRVLMAEGAVRVFHCDSTERDVFALREVQNT